jgi:hypothetical protein
VEGALRIRIVTAGAVLLKDAMASGFPRSELVERLGGWQRAAACGEEKQAGRESDSCMVRLAQSNIVLGAQFFGARKTAGTIVPAAMAWRSYLATVMAGGFHVPSMMDGGVSFGQ